MTRFWSRVERTETCWLWTGATLPNGYAHMRIDGTYHMVHRVAYELFVGSIPTDCVIDHVCEVLTCVNPDHLEAVPQRVNAKRALQRGNDRYERGIECLHGHSGDIFTDNLGTRRCRACRRESQRKYRQRRGA
jgi:hypothetical protein